MASSTTTTNNIIPFTNSEGSLDLQSTHSAASRLEAPPQTNPVSVEDFMIALLDESTNISALDYLKKQPAKSTIVVYVKKRLADAGIVNVPNLINTLSDPTVITALCESQNVKKFADVTAWSDILSIAGDGIFPHLSMLDAATLRTTCTAALLSVKGFIWHDKNTQIKSRLGSWRASFPRATAADVSRYRGLVDGDFVHLRPYMDTAVLIRGTSDPTPRPMLYVDMHCRYEITDAAFAHLEGIQELNLFGCPEITDAAFVHFKGIKKLNIGYCRSITDAAFAHLEGIQELNMYECKQITDAAFVHLKGIQNLYMSGCYQAGITDAAFAHLTGIQQLDISFCYQINDAAFAYLKGIQELHMAGSKRITDGAFAHLTGIQELDMFDCELITDVGIAHLKGIQRLKMRKCYKITKAALAHLKGI